MVNEQSFVSFSKDFVQQGINSITSMLPIVCGVPDSVLTSTNEKYSVSLELKDQNFRINAWLQDKFDFNISSEWSPVPMSGVNGFIDSASQMLTGVSLMSTAMSRRKWSGSSPIEMRLKLKFEAINDVQLEVIQPCLGLQQLALPSGGKNVGGNQIFLNPPGPNPFYIDALDNDKRQGGHKSRRFLFGRGEEIILNIGQGFLTFDSVIVKSVDVMFENRMSQNGPIGAEVKLCLQTYEMLTREKLAAIYHMKQMVVEGVK